MPNKNQLAAMRSWVKDCQWADVPEESDVDEMSDAEIIAGVNRHYDGGVHQFMMDCEAVPH